MIRAAPPRQSAKSTFDHICSAPEYVQKRPMSSLFCGCGQNFFNLGKSSAPVQSRHSTQKWALRQYECKSDKCQVFFAGLHKIFLNCISLCASAKVMCKTDLAPAPFYPQSLRVSSVICRYAQNKFNSRRSWRGVDNMI